MGVARYGGRGQVFDRLIVADKKHEREIETVIIRAAAPQLVLNDRKKALGIEPGSVCDYEPRTEFYERQRIRGKKKAASKKRS